jgi:predicted nucleic acid-binding protein
MTFDDLLAGESVFLDANTLVYHFQPHPTFGPAATQLFQRIQRQDLSGFSTSHVYAEVIHRLMTFEASATFGWPFAGIGNRLRQNPNDVSSLTAFRGAMDDLLQSTIQLLPVTRTCSPRPSSTASRLGC